ncbi:hypothetical protein GCM10027610_001380 [Dactylosporangium cerinum]
MCSTCDFWQWQFNLPGGLIINGEHYRIGEEPTADALNNNPSQFGSYGRRYVIRFLDGREVVTHNLWHQGAIPDALRRPDSAAFVWHCIVCGAELAATDTRRRCATDQASVDAAWGEW